MYREITFDGIRDIGMMNIWKRKVPLKIKHFLYAADRGRLPCAAQLIKRKWQGGNEFCKLCGKIESTNHILFYCPLAIFTSCVVRDALGLTKNPINIRDCLGLVKGKKKI